MFLHGPCEGPLGPLLSPLEVEAGRAGKASHLLGAHLGRLGKTWEDLGSQLKSQKSLAEITAPNPWVGAIVVGADGTVLGEGFHKLHRQEIKKLVVLLPS